MYQEKHDMPYGLRFSMLNRSFKNQVDRLLRENDLTGVQLGLLGQLARLKCSGLAEVRQKDLEQATGLGHPTITELLKRLEKKGLIEIRPCSQDRRSKSISATEKAGELHSQLKQVDRAVFERLTEGIDEIELASFFSVLDSMLENADKCRRKGCD